MNVARAEIREPHRDAPPARPRRQEHRREVPAEAKRSASPAIAIEDGARSVVVPESVDDRVVA
jgi:hypothetical protein